MGQVTQDSIYIQRGDRLRITVYSQVSNAVLAITGRTYNHEQGFVPYQHAVSIEAAGLQTVVRPMPGDHWLTDCMVSVVSGTVNPGDILVKVQLVQGDVTTQVPYNTLLVGSPDSFVPVAMGTNGRLGTQGRQARLSFFEPVDPAAGDDYVKLVPAGVEWELVAVQVALDTSADVANRFVHLDLYPPDGGAIVNYAGAAVVAATSVVINFIAGFGDHYTVGTNLMVGFARGIRLTPGSEIDLTVENGTATDQLSSIAFTFYERILG